MTVLWIILALCGIWLALTELPAGADGHNPLPYLLALTPFLYIPLIVVLAVGISMHDWVFTICCAMVLIASLARKTLYVMNNIQAPNTAQRVADYYARKRELAEHATRATDTTSAEHDAAFRTIDGNHRGSFRAMTLNCRYGRADAADIVRIVQANDIAVLSLQEMSRDLVDRLHDQGLDDLLPFHTLGAEQATDNGGFNGIWTRVAPLESTASVMPFPAAAVPAVKIRVSDTQCITFASAHPKSPMRGCRAWSDGIIGLGALALQVRPSRKQQLVTYSGRPLVVDDIRPDVEETKDEDITVATMSETRAAGTARLNAANRVSVRSTRTDVPLTREPRQSDAYEAVAGFAGDPTEQRGAVNAHGRHYAFDEANRKDIVVIMGDLNSSIPHPSFRKLMRDDLYDAALTEAKGIHATFPSWLPWPRIVLDHILFTKYLTARDVKQIKVAGSDHLALTSTLVFTEKRPTNQVLVRHRAVDES